MVFFVGSDEAFDVFVVEVILDLDPAVNDDVMQVEIEKAIERNAYAYEGIPFQGRGTKEDEEEGGHRIGY